MEVIKAKEGKIKTEREEGREKREGEGLKTFPETSHTEPSNE